MDLLNLTKTRCRPDPHHLQHVETLTGKRHLNNSETREGGTKITKGKKLLAFPHFVLGFSKFSTKKLMPTSSVSVGPQSVGVL